MKTILLIIGAVIVVGAAIWQGMPCANFSEGVVSTSSHAIRVALQITQEEQGRGLAGCTYIPKNSGMYFVFDDTAERIFWMKGMVIPIDIIWIADGRVVGIHKQVQPEPLETADTYLAQYTSPQPVDAVLEVAAGVAEVYGIREGVELSLDRR